MIKAFEIPNFKFDKNKLKDVYSNNKADWAKYGPEKLSLHTQYISLEEPVILEHLQQIKNYKNIVENVKFFKTLVSAGVGPHKDKRNVAINIPIIVDNKSYVAFYEESEVTPSVLSIKNNVLQSKAKYYKNSKPIDIFKSEKVFCLNTNTIHGVINESTSDRVILSISFKDAYNDFDLIRQMYENGELL
jgi:hypothetical protein